MLAARLLGPTRVRDTAISVEERLKNLPTTGLPVSRPVEIHWSREHIPFITAHDDRDLAVGVGLAHAHLRLAQIEIMRRLALGRLAEIVGPPALEVDKGMRIMGLAAVARRIEAAMPPRSREWIEGFVDGINAMLAGAPQRPAEFSILGIEPEPWSVHDVLAIGRLAAGDFSWKVWRRLAPLTGRQDWSDIWERLMRDNLFPDPSLAGSGALEPFMGRHGSNSFAISARRSATGSAVIANDPHLSVVLPNLWLIAGLHSPGLHAVGLMVPGLPIVGLGRNRWLAWGGTSLHAASSDLFDAGQFEAHEITRRDEVIRVRWSKPVTIEVRETPAGPIISDTRLARSGDRRELVLRWIGHFATDETTAMLDVIRARDWEAFHKALDGFAAPAQNMIVATADGRVGQAMAAHLPRRPRAAPDDLVAGADAGSHWDQIVTAGELPCHFDPECGFVASANNRPRTGGVPVGFFFSPDERVNRIRALIDQKPTLSFDDIAAIQRDIVIPGAARLRDRLVGLIDAADRRAANDPAVEDLLTHMRDWEADYSVGSRGALAFELTVYQFLRRLHGKENLALYLATWDPWALVHEDLDTISADRLQRAMRDALRPAARRFRKYGNWGAAHRLRLQHFLGAVPLLGRRFRLVDEPVAGANESVMKTAHGLSGRRHSVRMGAVARQISDLSDPDSNYFVLLGGQDGWLGSDTFLDQHPLWREGRYVKVPLRPEAARRAFPHHTRHLPSSVADELPEVAE